VIIGVTESNRLMLPIKFDQVLYRKLPRPFDHLRCDIANRLPIAGSRHSAEVTQFPRLGDKLPKYRFSKPRLQLSAVICQGSDTFSHLLNVPPQIGDPECPAFR